MAVALSLALLVTAVPTAQANPDCARAEVLPIDGLEEATLKLCDRSGDQVPDHYTLLVPLYDLELSGQLEESSWGNDQRAHGDTGLTGGYPVAPTVETRYSAIDENKDSSWERVKVHTVASAAMPTDPAVGLFIGLEDNDDDGIHEDSYLVACSTLHGCLYATDPLSLVGLLIDLVPYTILDRLDEAGDMAPDDLVPDNVP